MIYLGIFLLLLGPLVQASQQPQLIPPLSPAPENGLNVTGSLNTFVEQIRSNSFSGSGSNGPESAVQMPAHQAPPVIILGPQAAPAPQASIPAILPLQPQPPQMVQNQPAIDPALQRLLNSFNTNQQPQQVAYSVAPMTPGQPTVISYVTCYVGCSHVTNVMSAAKTVNANTYLLIGTILMAFMLAI